MTDGIYRTQLRLPNHVYEQLKALAEQSGRSLNSEIVHRLESSLQSNMLCSRHDIPTERQNAELLLEFEYWQRELNTSLSEKMAYQEYCRLYNDESPGVGAFERVIGIKKVMPRTLRDLAIAFRRYASESIYLQEAGDSTQPQRLAQESRKGKLMLGYLQYCKSLRRDPLDSVALEDFCSEYNLQNASEELRNNKRVIGIARVTAIYLEELIKTWAYEVPTQLRETMG